MNLPCPSRSRRASFGTGACTEFELYGASVTGVLGALRLPESVSRDSMAISASFGDASARAPPNCRDGDAVDSETLDLVGPPLRWRGSV